MGRTAASCATAPRPLTTCSRCRVCAWSQTSPEPYRQEGAMAPGRRRLGGRAPRGGLNRRGPDDRRRRNRHVHQLLNSEPVERGAGRTWGRGTQLRRRRSRTVRPGLDVAHLFRPRRCLQSCRRSRGRAWRRWRKQAGVRFAGGNRTGSLADVEDHHLGLSPPPPRRCLPLPPTRCPRTPGARGTMPPWPSSACAPLLGTSSGPCSSPATSSCRCGSPLSCRHSPTTASGEA